MPELTTTKTDPFADIRSDLNRAGLDKVAKLFDRPPTAERAKHIRRLVLSAPLLDDERLESVADMSASLLNAELVANGLDSHIDPAGWCLQQAMTASGG